MYTMVTCLFGLPLHIVKHAVDNFKHTKILTVLVRSRKDKIFQILSR